MEASLDDVERVVDAGSDSTADTAQKHVLPRRQLVPAEERGQPRFERLVAREVHSLPTRQHQFESTGGKKGAEVCRWDDARPR